MKDQKTLQRKYKRWMDGALGNDSINIESRWSGSVVVGSREFVEKISD